MDVFHVCVCVHNVHVWCQQMSEEVVRSLETIVMDGCELQCGCWESDSRLLQEQLVLLNTQPSLQPKFFLFLKIMYNLSLWYKDSRQLLKQKLLSLLSNQYVKQEESFGFSLAKTSSLINMEISQNR